MTDRSDHCVYLYRAPTTQKIVYVGRGATPGQPEGHLASLARRTVCVSEATATALWSAAAQASTSRSPPCSTW